MEHRPLAGLSKPFSFTHGDGAFMFVSDVHKHVHSKSLDIILDSLLRTYVDGG